MIHNKLRQTPPDPNLPKPSGAKRRPLINANVTREARALLSMPETDRADLQNLRRFLRNVIAYHEEKQKAAQP